MSDKIVTVHSHHSQKRKKIINTTKGTLLGHFVVMNDEKDSWTFHGPAVFFSEIPCQGGHFILKWFQSGRKWYEVE
jgi:hypothetical protein